MARKIYVEILGDSKSLEAAFARSAKSAQQFNQQLGGSNISNTLKDQTAAVQGITKAEEDLIKVRSRRASSIGPFRFAGVGLAAGLGLFAATQAVRELGASLETTGDAAFTAEGRIKNMVAALTGGNIVGAMKALTNMKDTLAETGMSRDAISPERLNALYAVSRGFPGLYKNMASGSKAFADAQARQQHFIQLAGTASKEEAAELYLHWKALRDASVATDALNDATERLGSTFRTQSGAIVEWKGALDDMAGPRGPGAIAAGTMEREARPARPSIGPLSPSQRRELELIGTEGAERIALLQDRLRQLNKQMERRNFNDEQRLKILTNIRNTEAEIAGITADLAAKRAADAEEARRAAEAAAAKAEQARQERIRTRTGWLEFGIEQAGATKSVKDDVKAYRALEKYLLERVRQEGRTLELVREIWRTRQKIKDLSKSADVDPLAGLQQASTKQMLALLSAGTGLRGAGRATLGANISGLQAQPLYIGVNVDGREIGRASTKDQTRTGKRTGKQTSGRRG